MDCLPVLHIAAYHASPGYNNDTPGLGLLCPVAARVNFGIGAYHNSLRRPSTYAGISWQPWQLGPVAVGGMVGAVTGYTPSPRLAGALVASLPVSRAAVHLTIAPDSRGSPGVAALSISWKLN